MRYLRSVRFLPFVVALVTTGSIYADGMYFPPEAVEILPKMPHQRAVIFWRDGVEQLLVESDFDGAGERMAWIVPVPAEPTDVAEGAPGVFDVLDKALVPKTIDSGSGLFVLAIFLLLWCVCQWALGVYAPKRALKYAIACSALFFFLFMTTPTMFMSLGDSIGGGPGLSEGPEVLAHRTVGSYEVTTLRAKGTEELTRWLDDNGFRDLPEAGESIVSEYIAEGWCFVAAKLNRTGAGYTRPHPLSITFPADEPVYPMRLTRLADTDLFLDLYVIADRRAKALGMETVFCERFRRGEDDGVEKVWGTRYSEAETSSTFFQTVHAGDSMGFHVNRTKMALPWLVERMRDKDVLTHLRAQVPVDAMHQDIPIDFRWFTRTRPRLMLPEDQKAASIGYALCAFGLTLGLGLMTHYKRVQQERKPLKKSITLLAASTVALVASQYPAWTTEPGQVQAYDRYDRRSVTLEHAFESLGENPTILEGMDKAAIEAWFLECLTYPKAGNAAAGDFLGEGPGRFEIIEDERGILLRTFGKDNDYFYPNLGVPLEYPLLTPEGKAVNRTGRSFWTMGEAVLSVSPGYDLSFDYVAPGQRKAFPITLSNRGGPVVSGYIKAPPPYFVREKQSKYTLKPGTSIQVEIEYRPEREGVHEYEIEFIGNDTRELGVYGISYTGQRTAEGISLDDKRGVFGRGGEAFNSTQFRTYYAALSNDNTFPVDLHGWGITNDPKEPYKHIFPEHTVIAPGDYMIVYLLSKPLRLGEGYSVGFELQPSAEGYLGLTNPEGKLISSNKYKLTRTDDRSWGLPGR
jgi:hypothetical protein